MRVHSDQLEKVLTGSRDRILHVDVFRGTDRVLMDLRPDDWSLKWDYSEVGLGGTLTVTVVTDDGVSLIPKGPAGLLSPHAGASVLLLEETRAGSFVETTQLGWARITGYRDAYDSTVEIGGRSVVYSTTITLELEGIEVGVVRDGLEAPAQPASGTTCYREIRRLSGLGVEETLPDKPAPDITYEASQGGRWKACLELAKHLGGVLYVTQWGDLTVHDPDVALSGTLHVGEDGTVTDVIQSASTDAVYNCVVGSFEDENGMPLYATAEVIQGPMSVTGAYGRYTRYYSSDFVNTQEQAQSTVEAILAQYTWGQLYEVPVKALTNPLVEVGDRWEVVSDDRTVEGIVTSVGLSDGPLMDVVLEVAHVW